MARTTTARCRASSSEFPEDLIEEVRPRIQISRPVAAGRFKPPVEELAPGVKLGARVRHKKFGEGVILKVEGQGPQANIQVNFASLGVKIMMLEYLEVVQVKYSNALMTSWPRRGRPRIRWCAWGSIRSRRSFRTSSAMRRAASSSSIEPSSMRRATCVRVQAAVRALRRACGGEPARAHHRLHQDHVSERGGDPGFEAR